MKPQVFEEWSVEKQTGEKIKKLREVSIHVVEAEDQNKDSIWTGLKYFEKKAEPKTEADNEKEELWATINALELPEGVKKPHHMSKPETLNKFIEENSK